MLNSVTMVSVVVLNWNGWQDTIRCIESILNSDYRQINIIVCDNGSDDDSVMQIKAWCTLHNIDLADKRSSSPGSIPDIKVTIKEIGANLGFARGNNVGIRHALLAGSDYIFVLNNDTTVSPACINNLVAFGEKTAKVALMGPKILDEGTTQYTQRPLAHRLTFPTIVFGLGRLRRLVKQARLSPRYSFISDDPAPVYVIPGSAMMFRAESLREINLFDETTFLYWEEFIVAEKLRQRGLVTYLVPAAVLWHKQNASIIKIGAGKYLEYVKSERHFVTHYLKLSFWKRIVLVAVRILVYVSRSVRDRSYRLNFPRFLKVLFSPDTFRT